jgi:hypothetical protein
MTLLAPSGVVSIGLQILGMCTISYEDMVQSITYKITVALPSKH